MAAIDKYNLIYRQSIDDLSEALDEKESLEDRLQEVIARVQKLREVAYSVSSLCGCDPRAEYPRFFVEDVPDVGFTDAVRAVFNPGTGLTPLQVRDTLKEAGFKLENYKNPLATIHTILKRLKKNNELIVVPDEDDGPTTYIMPPNAPKKAPTWFGRVDMSKLIEELAKVSEKPRTPQTRKQQRLANEAALHDARGEANEAKQAREAIEDIERRKRIRKLESGKKD